VTSEISHSSEESIILTLFDLVNYLTKNGESMSRQSGLTVQQWILLLQVAGDPNFPQLHEDTGADPEVRVSTIARNRGVTRPSVSAQVTALIRMGMLTQQEDPQDRRRKALHVTKKGQRALSAIEPSRRGANRSLFKNWSAAELEGLLEALQACLRRLARSSPGGSNSVTANQSLGESEYDSR
jgi:MarR family transcriptional regulator for hemolysin